MTSQKITELDLTGLQCPLPLLKTKQAIYHLPADGLIRIATTDPSSQLDFQRFTQLNGHTLMDIYEVDGVYKYTIKKKGKGHG